MQNVLYEKSVTTYLHKYRVYYTFISVCVQWCEKVFACFLISFFFACLSDLNVSDHQTNPSFKNCIFLFTSIIYV